MFTILGYLLYRLYYGYKPTPTFIVSGTIHLTQTGKSSSTFYEKRQFLKGYSKVLDFVKCNLRMPSKKCHPPQKKLARKRQAFLCFSHNKISANRRQNVYNHVQPFMVYYDGV